MREATTWLSNMIHWEKRFAYVSIITKSICWRPLWIVDHLEVGAGERSNEDYLL